MSRILALGLLMACGGSSATPVASPTPSNAASPGASVAAPNSGVCANRPDTFGPYVLDAQQAAMRYGLTATKYADAPATQDKPIEVCGVRGEEAWLHSRTCTNGRPGAEGGRGDVGPGGRCGAIIDVYEIKCPEGTLHIAIDMYQCGPNETFL